MHHKTLSMVSLVATVLLAGFTPGCGDGSGSFDHLLILGVQIDRIGRAGINTAVTDPFNANAAAHAGMQDAYNAASDEGDWPDFAEAMATNLAILDGLDRNCGNQLLAGATATAGRYDGLAGVLADDKIYVNTDSGICTQYLAVEADAVGIDNDDCGGRTPLYDTIDTSYSVLAAGALAGVGDGVPVDTDSPASVTAFPFLADPE